MSTGRTFDSDLPWLSEEPPTAPGEASETDAPIDDGHGQGSQPQPSRPNDLEDSTPQGERSASNAIATKIRTAVVFCRETPDEVPWIVPGIAAMGASTELVGRPKAAGKTTFLLAFAKAAVSGGVFLGALVSRTRVLYLTEQSGTSFRRAIVRAGLEDSPDFYVLTWGDCSDIKWTALVPAVVRWALANGIGLLTVDTLGQFAGFRGDEENATGAAQAAMEPLQAATAQGLAVIVARHERKSGGSVGDSGRGSSAFTGAVDIVLALRRRDNDTSNLRTLLGLSRFEETPDEVTIEWDGSSFISHGETTSPLTARAGQTILAVLPSEDQVPISVPELVASLRLPKSTVNDALQELEAQQLVARKGKGVRGDPYRWYRLSSDASAADSGAESNAA